MPTSSVRVQFVLVMAFAVELDDDVTALIIACW